MDDLGAVVLCGGRSTRMGRPKALLPFGRELLLVRVIARIAPAVGPIAVVAAPEQELPALPDGVQVVRDPVEGEGPLAGMAVGLAALATRARFAYLTATDAPFVAPAFVRRMRALCDASGTREPGPTRSPFAEVGNPQSGSDFEVAVPMLDGRYHPLAGVYATQLGAVARELLAAGQRRPIAIYERARTRAVSPADLLADPAVASEDPELATLRNLNTPEDYQAALADAGLAPTRA